MTISRFITKLIDKVTSTHYKNPLRHSSPAPLKETTAVRYSSDGSGRDAYVLYNSGGNYPTVGPGRSWSFVRSLRSESFIKDPLPYQRNSSRRQLDFHDYQGWLNQSVRKSQDNLANVQMRESLRLSTPKRDARVFRPSSTRASTVVDTL